MPKQSGPPRAQTHVPGPEFRATREMRMFSDATRALVDTAFEILGRDRAFVVVMESMAAALCGHADAETVADLYRSIANTMDEVAQYDMAMVESVELLPLPHQTENGVVRMCEVLLARAVAEIGLELAVSVIVSRIGRELRRHFGVKDAKQRFRRIAATVERRKSGRVGPGLT